VEDSDAQGSPNRPRTQQSTRYEFYYDVGVVVQCASYDGNCGPVQGHSTEAQ